MKQNRSFSQCITKATVLTNKNAENEETDWLSDTSPIVRMNIPLPTSTCSDRLLQVKNTLHFVGHEEDLISYKYL